LHEDRGVKRFVVVTGASSGIGESCVARLARAGYDVFAGVRKAGDAERLRRDFQAVPLELELADRDSIAAAADAVCERTRGRGLAGLVNNAGFGVSGPIEYIPDDVLRRQFEVNVFGQIALTQALLPLIRQAGGRIINMGSVGSHLTMPFGGALCSTKSAFRALNDALRLELHPFGIHVCMIEPAAIRTPAVDKTLGDPDGAVRALPPEGAARYGDMLRRFMRRAHAREQAGSSPAVVADAVLTALSAKHPRAHYPVGQHARLLMALPSVLTDGLLDQLRYRLFGIPGHV
jgi:NAD(P)-dependent dehydrogenase (short-subunit alcohol dehydrogenase family)